MNGKRLIQIRKIKKITQNEIAQKLNISKSTYCTWEKGLYEPSIENLIKIAKILETPIDYILNQDENISEIETLYYPLSEENKEKVKAYIQGISDTTPKNNFNNIKNSFNNNGKINF
ncbi:MAG: helix-turn-helix domain-containing protein [Clostridiales bacterium]|jgi:transcriptional regulator with XRE-family HTH domain|nr:helix-turn-helix domain-containing protein [Clostridiales bacterium]